MKKFGLFVLLVLLVVSVIKYQKIKSYFEQQKYFKYLEKLHILKHCYCPHPDIFEIFKQEGFDYHKEDQKVTSDSLKKIHNLTDKSNLSSPKIPLKTHRVYFSGSSNQIKLDVFYIEEMKTHYNNLNKLAKNWKHYIWTNNVGLIPQEITSINGVIVKDIEEFKTHRSYPNLVEILNKGKDQKPYLTEATDLARLIAVEKFGGIYSDMDYELYNPTYIFNLMREHDFIGARETMRLESFYANSFFAAKANHPIISFALEKIYRNYNKISAPEYIKYPCNIYDRILFSGPVLMTIAYFAKNNIEGNNDMILPSWMMINVDFSRQLNNYCKLPEITEAYYNDKRKILTSIVEEFMLNPKVEEWQYTCNQDNPEVQNMFYTIKDHKNYEIIGADAMCGTWIIKGNHKKYFYYNLPWKE